MKNIFSVLIALCLISWASISVHASNGQTRNASLGDYWKGLARWELVRSWNGPVPSHIEIGPDGTWYLFSRWGYLSTANCPEKLGTFVQKSTDRGATWTPSISDIALVHIVVPTVGTPWSCIATDGDVYYETGQNKWHYLFQCKGDDNLWRGCHLERQGSDPMGPFTQTHTNPVIDNGALWRQICDQPGDDCVTIPGKEKVVNSEGTFNIFNHDGTYFWVSFHGWDGPPSGTGNRGYRGIAKTKDFVNWIAGDPSQGVPGDAIVDRNDGLDWRAKWINDEPIGAGAGWILKEDDYYYLVTEIADVSLECTAGQNWHVGIFRSASLTNTTWEQYPLGNPILYSTEDRTAPCPLQYAQLFKDSITSSVYFKVGRIFPEEIYLYQLVPSNNLLKNGDLWQADEGPSPQEDWKRIGTTTNLKIYRLPRLSSDGNNFMAMNCGTLPNPCSPGQSIYQDVDASTHAGRSFTFGGKLATEGNETGSINVVVHQLDQYGSIIKQDSVRVNAGPAYTAFSGEGFILRNSKTLRYQLYLESPVTFFADEMYVEIPQGNILVSNDEWTLSDEGGFTQTPDDARRFALNIAGLFTADGVPGNFLVYSSQFQQNSGLVGNKLKTTMEAAGHSWTIQQTTKDFSVHELLQYDGIFLAGYKADTVSYPPSPPDTLVLIDYVKAGGNVYIAGGTDLAHPREEAAQWNPLLNACGLSFQPVNNNLTGSPRVNPAYQISTHHPIFTGVERLYQDNGSSISKLNPASPDAAILARAVGPSGAWEGLYAICSFDKLEPWIVNDLVTLLEPARIISSRPANVGGISWFVTIRAKFKILDNSTVAVLNPFFRVVELKSINPLTYQVLYNADGGPKIARPEDNVTLTPTSDDILSPGEVLTVDFEIGLFGRKPFTFFVDMLGAGSF